MSCQELIRCPECGSTEIWRNGYVMRTTGKKQRYQCLKCGHIFNEEQI